MQRIEATSIYNRIYLIRNGGLGFKYCWTTLASVGLENKDRRHIYPEAKLLAIFPGGEGIGHHILGLI